MLRNGVVRGLAILVLVAGWLAVGAFGGMSQGQLSQVQTNDSAAFLPSSAESTRAATEAEAFTEGQALPVLVVITADRADAALPADAIGTVTAAVEQWPDLPLPGAGAGNPATVGDVLTADPVVVPSEDGEALLVPLSLDADQSDTLLANDERVTGAVVEVLRDALADDLEGTSLQSWVTGPAGFVADLVTAFGGIDGVLLLVALGAVLVILVLVYRSPFLPFLVIINAVFALCAAALVVYHLADAGVLTLNGQAQGILSILVVGASVDYALLIVARYREELRLVESPAAAMRQALRASLEPISASAGTVIAGLLCLLLSDLASNRSLGPVGAIGIVAAYAASFSLLPLMLLMLGKRSRGLFWPRRPVVDSDPTHSSHGLWEKLAGWVGRQDRKVWIGTTVVLLIAAAFLPTFQAQGTSQSDVFRTQVDSVDGEKVLAEHFPAGAVQPATVFVDADEAQDVIEAAQGVDGVLSATPYTGASSFGGPPSQEAQQPPVEVDGRVRIDVTTEAGADTSAGVDAIERVRTAVHEVAPDALVGGAAAETLDAQDAGTRDLRVIVPVVLIVILLILMLLLRSVLAAVLLMLANVLSFAAALGVAAVVFNHVLDYPGADPAVPLYAFTFLIALGVDYSIFLMTRVREESLKVGTRDGVRHGLAVTGGVITSAGVVLAMTFAALGVIPLLFLAQLAFIVAFGVLVDTLVVRSLLVPALVHDIGDRVWWPSKIAR
ncbi:MMPL family transporter [Cellulomonas taurus]|uniref:MMPL family transporter n=1 Tax=Cellulomonas taurus TaxID=2729175 RepID=UPI00197D7464|nr:MMPL family transporter [Cellulomonas taurus]